MTCSRLCILEKYYRILFLITDSMIMAMSIFTKSTGMNGITQTAKAALEV